VRALPRFGPYQALRELARGGMGVVYEAVHGATGARHALKTIMRGAEVEEVARFRREAEVLGRLDHPHIVRVHAAELAGATPWMAQDLLPGGTLAERLARGPLAIDEALALARKLARALDHAHARGVLHRDLKPANVVYDDRGEPRLVDFGLGRALEFARLTATGAILGTPGFMAPELALGERGDDVRTDVYGLGALLYAALTSKAPFEGSSAVALFRAVTQGDAPPLRRARPDAPAWLEDVVARALARRPEERFQDVAALLRALDDGGAGGSRPRARRRGPALLVALSVAGLAAAAVVLPGRAPAVVEPPRRPLPPAPSALEVTSAAEAAPVTTRPATREDVAAILATVKTTGDPDEIERRLSGLSLELADQRAVARACLDAARKGVTESVGVTQRAFAGDADARVQLVYYFAMVGLAERVSPAQMFTEEDDLGGYQQIVWSQVEKAQRSTAAPALRAVLEVAPSDPVIVSLDAICEAERDPARARAALLRQLERLRGPGAGDQTAWFRSKILQALDGLLDDQLLMHEVALELDRPDHRAEVRALAQELVKRTTR
jgi:serine/threonine-protein kinase